MNFQSIQILSMFIAISYTLHSPPSPRLLTHGENLERLESCGRGYKDSDEKKWFWVAQSSDLTMFANRISKRHFITFSSLLVAMNDQWMEAEERIQRTCEDGINLRIPPAQLSHLRILTADCFSVNPQDHADCQRAIPVNAWIPHFCESDPEDRTPMIIEVAEDIKEGNGMMCVAVNDFPRIRRYSWAQMYVLRQEDGLNKWNVQIDSISQDSYFLGNNDVFTDNSEYSGLLTHTVNGKKYLIGYRDARSGDPIRFHRISWFSDEICKLTGICVEEKVTEAPVPSSTESGEPRSPETTTGGPKDPNTSPVSSETIFSTSMETTNSEEPSTPGPTGPEETTPWYSEDPVTSAVPSSPGPSGLVPITTVPLVTLTTVPTSTSTSESGVPDNIVTTPENSEEVEGSTVTPEPDSSTPKIKTTVLPRTPISVPTTITTIPPTRTKNPAPKRTRRPIPTYPEEPIYDYEEYERIPFEEDEDIDYFGIWTQINGGNRKILMEGLIILVVFGFLE